MTALLVRPPPERNEGPSGYLLRLAEANHLLFSDLRDLGISYKFELLKQHGLLPPESLDPDLWAWVQRLADLAENKGRIWNSRTARFCPHCLRDEPTWKACWELYFHDACLKHGVWLVDRCSSCHQQLGWSRGNLLRCECGADLRLEVAASCPREVRSLAGALEFRLKRSNLECIPEPIDGLELEEIQRLVKFLGTHLDPNMGSRPMKLRSADAMEVSWRVTSKACAILEFWPESFEQALNEVLATASNTKQGIAATFKNAYHYLYRGLAGSRFEPFRLAFETWLVENWMGGIAKRNRRLSEELLKRVTWIPAKLAADELGVTTGRIRQLVSENLLEGQEFVSVKSQRKFLVVRRDQLASIERLDLTEMDMKSAVAVLGVGKVRMREILRLLFPSAYRPRTKNGFSTWRVNRSDVEKYLSIGQGLPILPIPDESQVSLQHILKYWCWNGEEIVDLVEAVRDAKVEIQGMLDGATGLGRWIFDAQGIQVWRRGRNTGLANWMSNAEAAKALKVHPQVMYWLTANEFVVAEKLPGIKAGGVRISKAELERFQSSYVLGKEIASRLGVSPKKVVSVLAAQGFAPVSQSGVERCRQVFFARSARLISFIESAESSGELVGKSNFPATNEANLLI